MAFSYTAPLTVQSSPSQITGTLTNYPALVSNTFDGTGGMPDLRIVGTGTGKIQNEDTSGTPASKPADFGFYSDSGLTALLKFEIETWNKTTGLLIAHVKVASIADSAVIYMGYGDAAITTALDDAANVWTNSYTSVYHFGSPSTLAYTSSVGSHTLTGTNTPTAGTGKIHGGIALASASSQYAANSDDQLSAAISYEAWIKGTSFPGAYNTVVGNDAAVAVFCDMHVKSNGKLAMYLWASGMVSYDGTGSTLSTGTWYHVGLTYSVTNGLVGYLSGAVDGTGATSGSGVATPATDFSVGNNLPGFPTRYFDGVIDELRVSSVERTAAYMAACFNNQSAPTTFWIQGSEASTGGSGRTTKNTRSRPLGVEIGMNWRGSL